VNDKHRAVISSYSDLSRLSSSIKIIHFRKFISKRILKIILKRCPNLKEISLSNYASKRLNKECKKLLSVNEIIIKVSFSKGRPNALELKRNINIDYKLIGEI
jgi:hypothetical protein